MENNFSDDIDKLPLDDIPLKQDELNLFNSLFSNVKNIKPTIEFKTEIKKIFFLFILYFLFSLGIIDTFFGKIIFSNTNKYFFIIIKGIVFVLMYWIISNKF